MWNIKVHQSFIKKETSLSLLSLKHIKNINQNEFLVLETSYFQRSILNAASFCWLASQLACVKFQTKTDKTWLNYSTYIGEAFCRTKCEERFRTYNILCTSGFDFEQEPEMNHPKKNESKAKKLVRFKSERARMVFVAPRSTVLWTLMSLMTTTGMHVGLHVGLVAYTTGIYLYRP